MSLSVSELLIIAFLFITSFFCALTYFLCVRTLKIFKETKSNSKAINKLRIYDQYILTKLNTIISVIYFYIGYLFSKDLFSLQGYDFFVGGLISFVLTLVTTVISRICYCYTCNVLLDTRLNEWECLIINFKRLLTVYIPFLMIGGIIPSIYLLNISMAYKNILSVVSLICVLAGWLVLTPKIMIINYNAKPLKKNSLLKHRLDKLMRMHKVERYKLYSWDTSKSKEVNAMVSGIRTNHLFVSSSLIEEVTLPELETIITHEIGHIKNRHLLKLMASKLYIVSCIVIFMVCPYIFDFNGIGLFLFSSILLIMVFIGVLQSIKLEKKYEIQADTYASNHKDKELFASAIKKISKYDEEENGQIDKLFQTHPSKNERINLINNKNNK